MAIVRVDEQETKPGAACATRAGCSLRRCSEKHIIAVSRAHGTLPRRSAVPLALQTYIVRRETGIKTKKKKDETGKGRTADATLHLHGRNLREKLEGRQGHD